MFFGVCYLGAELMKSRRDSLPDLSERVKTVKFKRPIEQHIIGRSGAFRQANIEKQRSYNLMDWKKLCESSEHQPPAKRGQVRRGHHNNSHATKTTPIKRKSDEEEQLPMSPDSLSSRNEESTFDYRLADVASYTPERCAELERLYWKSLSYANPLYGADMPGSLFGEETKEWNVANLDNLLKRLRHKIPGVNSTYLYLGMWKATFCWHVEDMDLYSINYIHFGAPKQWYSISQRDGEQFEAVMKANFSSDYEHCPQFIRHKTFHFSPAALAQHGIKVNRVVHREGEFIITFPFGYHSGFNMGYNCAESVNFATDAWLEIGRKALVCNCIPDSVNINVDDIINQVMDGDEEEEEVARPKKRLKKEKLPPTPPLPSCALCPSASQQDLLPTPSDSHVHRLCATYVPETWLSEEGLVMGVENINKARFSLKCLHCQKRSGACFQCDEFRCTRSYHSTCAADAGVSIEYLTLPNSDAVVPYFLCRFHRPRRALTVLTEEEGYDILCDYSRGLLPGEIVQAQMAKGGIFTGTIMANNESEESLIISTADGYVLV